MGRLRSKHVNVVHSTLHQPFFTTTIEPACGLHQFLKVHVPVLSPMWRLDLESFHLPFAHASSENANREHKSHQVRARLCVPSASTQPSNDFSLPPALRNFVSYQLQTRRLLKHLPPCQIAMTSMNEEFRPGFNAPVLPGQVHLDFESPDSHGNCAAPEARLKTLVLFGTRSRYGGEASGAKLLRGGSNLMHGVSGLAGVGKTISLIALGHDEDIKAHFIDGVLYMTIEGNAINGQVADELNKIMRVTGQQVVLQKSKNPRLLLTLSRRRQSDFKGNVFCSS